MRFREAISSVFRQYATFDGRARRSEYWYFVLFNILIYALMLIVSTLILSTGVAGRPSGMNAAMGRMSLLYILYGIYSLAIIIPGLALLCRRLHDIGRAGTYMLFAFIPFVGLIFLLIWVLQEGEPGPNRYGPDPKSSAAAAAPVRQPREERYAPQAGNQYNAPRPYVVTGNASAADSRKASPAPTQAQAQHYLEGVAGCFLGKRVPVRGSVTVGRHPSCGICFPNDTHGVSGRHCQFRAGGSSLVVTDVGSSYGTFVNNKRLPPDCPFALSRGDTVFLGSAKQGFRVI